MQDLESSGILNDAEYADAALKHAFKVARNQDILSPSDLVSIFANRATGLRAVVKASRLIWAQHFVSEVLDHLEDPETKRTNQPVFLVTLCDIDCATPITERNPDIRSFARKFQNGLRRLSFIGMIEPAYYTNIQEGSEVSLKKCISWHLHALVWGVDKAKLKERIDRFNQSGKFRGITKQIAGAHSEEVASTDLTPVLRYLLKPPVNAYRLSKRNTDADLDYYDCGEAIYDDARWKQGKSKMRSGERVALYAAMQGLSLPDLALAGGEGLILLEAIRSQALHDAGGSSRRSSGGRQGRARSREAVLARLKRPGRRKG